jgi:predicted nucleic acid-binding protein
MRRYLLDTNAAGDYINRRYGIRDRAISEVLHGNRLGICCPVLGELWFGVENGGNRERNRQRLLLAVADWTLWPFDVNAAKEYGRLATLLKRAGRIIEQIDIQLSAIALTLGNCTVVTNDNDLFSVPGLTVENWRVESEGKPA